MYYAHDASILLCARHASEITIISCCVLKDITFVITVIINVTKYDAATLVVPQTNAIWYPYIGPQLNVPRTDPQCSNKMKNKEYNTVGNLPKFNRRIVERDEIDTSNAQIHDNSLFGLGTGTSIKKKMWRD